MTTTCPEGLSMSVSGSPLLCRQILRPLWLHSELHSQARVPGSPSRLVSLTLLSLLLRKKNGCEECAVFDTVFQLSSSCCEFQLFMLCRDIWLVTFEQLIILWKMREVPPVRFWICGWRNLCKAISYQNNSFDVVDLSCSLKFQKFVSNC